MKIDTMQELLLNMCMEMVHIPVMFIGPSGCGKSWTCAEIADVVDAKLKKIEKKTERCFGYVDLRLATQEPGDIIGNPKTIERKTHDEEGNEVVEYITIWSKPCWFPEPGTRGLLNLEEVNRAPKDVQQCIFQALSERRIHTHKLPDGWIIASAINPDNGEYHVETLDKAFARRFCQIAVQPDARTWCRWAEEYGINERIIKFIRENKKMLTPEEEIVIKAIPTPEGYRMVDEILESGIIPDADGAQMEVIAGLIGETAAAALAQYLIADVENCVPATEILTDYDRVIDKALKQSNDRMNKTIEEFVIMFEKDNIPGTNQEMSNFKKFMKVLKPEWLTMLLMSIKANVKLLQSLGTDREISRMLLDIRSMAKS